MDDGGRMNDRFSCLTDDAAPNRAAVAAANNYRRG